MGMQKQGYFNINFLDFPTTNNKDKAQFKKYFIEYTPSKWDVGSGGASFVYFDANNQKYSLVVIENPKYGFCLMYDPSLNGCYSLGNTELLNKFFDDDTTMPIGAYISPELAWLAVEDFLDNPYLPSNRINWINDDDIPDSDSW